VTGRFFPTVNVIPCPGGFRGTIKRFEDEREKCIPGGKIFAEASEARRAAREYLATILNAEINGVQIAPPPGELNEIEKWREERRKHQEAERQRTFGDIVPKNRSGRAVVVERVRR